MDNKKEPKKSQLLKDGGSTEALIGRIVETLQPVRPYHAGRLIRLAMFSSLVASAAVLLVNGDVRISFIELGASGRLWNLRVCLAQAIFVMSSIMIVDLGVPRKHSLFGRRISKFYYFGLLGIALLAFVVISLSADIPHGIIFKRQYCIYEGVVIGLVSLAMVAISLRRSLSPDRGLLIVALFVWTTFLTINVMDVTCLVSISHSLRFHLLPIIVVALPAAWLVRSQLKKL